MTHALLTLDEARQRLAPTEGLAEYEFETDGDTNKLKFSYPDNWNENIDVLDDFDVTTASLDLDGHEFALTKSGALELASEIGLQKSYVERTPGNYIAPQLNYHYSNGANGKKRLKLLASPNGVVTVTRGTLQPFSNTRILDTVVEAMKERFSVDELMVDYKFSNRLDRTNMRLILPHAMKNIASARGGQAQDDQWTLGININNSIEGSSPLELSGYLYAFFCTNGMEVKDASSGKYRRKPSLTPDDAYGWARAMVDEVFTDLEPALERIEHLTNIPLSGEIVETAGQIFEQYDVPGAARERILNSLIENDDLSAYGLLASITQAANDIDDASPNEIRELLRIGGDVASAFDDRCPACHRL